MHHAMQRWYMDELKNGMDATVCMDEAFSQRMALEESGVATGLPSNVVKHARRIFLEGSDVSDDVMEKIKAGRGEYLD